MLLTLHGIRLIHMRRRLLLREHRSREVRATTTIPVLRLTRTYRFSLERYARKIGGRVFAINYRLAPQYPFPCAVQDFLAACRCLLRFESDYRISHCCIDLYLIRPPPEASHCPVDPAHIVVAGDSAGGGLSIALLQVIRDSGLPLPAGAFLISPWCDLTHSFPSVHVNNATVRALPSLPEYS